MLGPWPGSSLSVSGLSLGMVQSTSSPLDIGTASTDKFSSKMFFIDTLGQNNPANCSELLAGDGQAFGPICPIIRHSRVLPYTAKPLSYIGNIVQQDGKISARWVYLI